MRLCNQQRHAPYFGQPARSKPLLSLPDPCLRVHPLGSDYPLFVDLFPFWSCRPQPPGLRWSARRSIGSATPLYHVLQVYEALIHQIRFWLPADPTDYLVRHGTLVSSLISHSCPYDDPAVSVANRTL